MRGRVTNAKSDRATVRSTRPAKGRDLEVFEFALKQCGLNILPKLTNRLCASGASPKLVLVTLNLGNLKVIVNGIRSLL